MDGGMAWGGPAASRWGHWGAAWLVACVVALIGLATDPFGRGSIGAIVAPIVLFGCVVAGWLAMRRHDRALCEACVRVMPLNASEVAARYKRQFAVVHAGSNRLLVIAYLAVLVGSDLVLLRHGAAARACWMVIQSSMVYLVLAYSSHRRFQPWCPQCQGGDGDKERDPAPDLIPWGSLTG